jgi:hypothetical protein
VAGLFAASRGALGGPRGLLRLRAILGNIEVMALPVHVAVMRAHEALGADGRLTDTKQATAVRKPAQAAVRTAGKLNA